MKVKFKTPSHSEELEGEVIKYDKDSRLYQIKVNNINGYCWLYFHEFEEVKEGPKVTVNIWELQTLIAANRDMADSIPKESYDLMTKAGHTLGVSAKKLYDRARELETLLEKTWPK